MKKSTQNIISKIVLSLRQHRYGLSLIAILISAALTGMGCVWFMWAFEFVLNHRLDPESIGAWCLLTTPILFVVAVYLIRRFAPYADGAGIPQIVFASEHIDTQNEKDLAPLV